MKKISLMKSTLYLGTMLMMIACGKDEPDPAAPASPANPTDVVSSSQISKIILDGEDEMIFTYDSENRLSKVEEAYAYEDEYGSYSSSDIYTLTYANGKLATIEEAWEYSQISTDWGTYSGGYTETRTLTHNASGQLVSVATVIVETSDQESTTYSGTVTYEYDAQNRLVKQSHAYEDGEEWANFSWNENNVAKEQWYYSSGNSGGRKKALLRDMNKKSVFKRVVSRMNGELESESVYTDFDDKVNPLMILSILNGYSSGQAISQNNPTKIVDFYQDENGSMQQDETINISYVYDNQGRPTTITMEETEADGQVDEAEVVTIQYKN